MFFHFIDKQKKIEVAKVQSSKKKSDYFKATKTECKDINSTKNCKNTIY